jgi:dTMP kinase
VSLGLIAIEGVDGSGKSTLAHALTSLLTRDGVPCRIVRPLSPEPGFVDAIREAHADAGGPALERVKQDFLVGYFSYRLVAAGIAIRAKVEAGAAVIADRYVASHRVSQAIFGADLEPFGPLLARLPEPATTLYVRVSPATALARLAQRPYRGAGDDRAFVERAVELYDAEAEAGGWTVLDGELDTRAVAHAAEEAVLSSAVLAGALPR